VTRTTRRASVVGCLALAASMFSAGSADAAVTFCIATAVHPAGVNLGITGMDLPVDVQSEVRGAPAGTPPQTDCLTDWLLTESSKEPTTLFSATHQYPSVLLFPGSIRNSDAGRKQVVVRPLPSGPAASFPFLLRRSSTFGKTFNASPEPVRKNAKIKIKAKLGHANWDALKYAGYAKRTVWVQFKPAGTSTYVDTKKVVTTGGGAISTTVVAKADGTWRLRYAGTAAVYGPANSSGDYVDVRG
jgi:hypothetical protein